MSLHNGFMSRAQLIKSALAASALAACHGPMNATPFSGTRDVGDLVPNSFTDRFGLDEILANDVFKNIDKQALLEMFDPTPHFDANQQRYLKPSGQVVQHANVIAKIPAGGITISSPGTYTFGGNLTWKPSSTAAAAITIASSNVTLDMRGFTLKASIPVANRWMQLAGIAVASPIAPLPISNVTITNGTVSSVTEYGVFAKYVNGLKISGVNVNGICLSNLNVRLLAPTGIFVGESEKVAVANCIVSNTNVTTDSCAGFALILTNNATVTACSVKTLTNNDGAAQGFSAIGCRDVTTANCSADNMQAHFNGNVKATGHTVIGFIPIFCRRLTYTDCSATRLTGCCDDCHGMSVFLDAQVTVKRFNASQVLDGAGPEKTGAKSTGLEVYGSGVSIIDCTATGIRAINPEDKQAAAFSAWGILIDFKGCSASDVSVVNDKGGALGVGFGWAPDPRAQFAYTPAYLVTYTDCKANNCDVAFDTWYHVDGTWVRPTYTNCKTGFLVQPLGTRTITCTGCSECVPPITRVLINLASGNVYPH